MIIAALIFLFLCVAAAWLAIYGAHSTSENGYDVLAGRQAIIRDDIATMHDRVHALEHEHPEVGRTYFKNQCPRCGFWGFVPEEEVKP